MSESAIESWFDLPAMLLLRGVPVVARTPHGDEVQGLWLGDVSESGIYQITLPQLGHHINATVQVDPASARPNLDEDLALIYTLRQAAARHGVSLGDALCTALRGSVAGWPAVEAMAIRWVSGTLGTRDRFALGEALCRVYGVPSSLPVGGPA